MMDKDLRNKKMAEVAWRFAGKLIGSEMSYTDLLECYGTAVPEEIFDTYTYDAAVKKYADWKKISKFNVGDEVIGYNKGIECIGVVVNTNSSTGSCGVMLSNGFVCEDREIEWEKTGNMYPEVVDILKSLCDNEVELIGGYTE